MILKLATFGGGGPISRMISNIALTAVLSNLRMRSGKWGIGSGEGNWEVKMEMEME